MIRVKNKVKVGAPADVVWQTLSKLDDIEIYMQAIKYSKMNSTSNEGIGAERLCDIEGIGKLAERIVEWSEGTGFKYEVVEGRPAIMRKLSNKWEMRKVGNQTEVSMEIEVQAKYGLIGRLLEQFAIKPQVARTSKGGLAQVKYYLEEGQAYTGDVDKLIKEFGLN
jgi:uncharacterized membrane protein